MHFDFFWGQEPPSTNRGVNCQNDNKSSCETSSSNTYESVDAEPVANDYTSRFECAVDTITGIFRNVQDKNDAVAIINRFEDCYADRVVFLPSTRIRNGKMWDGHTHGSLRGLRFWWQKPTIGLPGQLMFSVSGRALSQVSDRATRNLFVTLSSIYEADCTRLDIALDDYRKIVSFGQIEEALRSKNISGCDPNKARKIEDFADTPGVCLYLGSKNSDKLLRIYDKSVESDGEKDCYRWEAQLRRHRANVVFQTWLSDGCKVDYLSSVVLGCVDFVDRSSGCEHVDRLPKLCWWEEFIALVNTSPVKIPCKKVVSALQKSGDWFFHCGPAKFLAKLEKSKGFDFAMDFMMASLEDAKQRFTQCDRAKSQIYETEQLVY